MNDQMLVARCARINAYVKLRSDWCAFLSPRRGGDRRRQGLIILVRRIPPQAGEGGAFPLYTIK